MNKRVAQVVEGIDILHGALCQLLGVVGEAANVDAALKTLQSCLRLGQSNELATLRLLRYYRKIHSDSKPASETKASGIDALFRPKEKERWLAISPSLEVALQEMQR